MQSMPVQSAPAEPLWTPRRVIVGTLIVLLVALGLYALYALSYVLFALFMAIVLGTALRPLVVRLAQYGIPARYGAMLVILFVALVIVGVLALMIPLLINQATTLIGELPGYYDSMRAWLLRQPAWLLRNAAQQLPATITFSPTSSTPADNTTAVTETIQWVRYLTWNVFGFMATVLIAYFWVVDHDQILRAVLLLVPSDRRPDTRELWESLELKVGAFIRGQALLCVSIGLISGIAFFAIGVPNALLLALLAGILEAVPYLGPIATTVLAVSVTLAQDPDKIWWVIGACLLIQQIENAYLVPRIMDATVGVNAVITLLSIAAFGALLGVSGAIMAIPMAVVIQALLDRSLFNFRQQAATPLAGRDQLAVLRYQAQDLVSDIRDRVRDNETHNAPDSLEEHLEAIASEIDEMLESIAAIQTTTGDRRKRPRTGQVRA